MLNAFLNKVVHWVETMGHEEYLIVVLIAIAIGFVFLKGMGSRHHM